MGTKFSEDSVKLERIKRSRNIWVSGLRTSFYMLKSINYLIWKKKKRFGMGRIGPGLGTQARWSQSAVRTQCSVPEWRPTWGPHLL